MIITCCKRIKKRFFGHSLQCEMEPLSESKERLRHQISKHFWSSFLYFYSTTKMSRFCSSSPGTRSRSLSTKMKKIRAPKAAFKVQPSSHSIIVNENLAQEKNNKGSFQRHFPKCTLFCCHLVSFHLFNIN